MHLKSSVLIDRVEYECRRDKLLPKRMCLESHDLFKFWEISHNISEAVHDSYVSKFVQ